MRGVARVSASRDVALCRLSRAIVEERYESARRVSVYFLQALLGDRFLSVARVLRGDVEALEAAVRAC